MANVFHVQKKVQPHDIPAKCFPVNTSWYLEKSILCGNFSRHALARVHLGNVYYRFLIMSAAITLEDLSLGYDGDLAISKVAASIEYGSLTAIIGPNGAGKSTLLKGIAGILKPIEGKIAISAKRRKHLAYLPQHSEIDRSFPISVSNLVAMGLWSKIGAFGALGKKEHASVSDALSAVGLSGFEKRSINTLSGGQFQRVLFARMLLQDADLILLDEPFSAIDLKTMADLIQIIVGWHQEGRTVAVVLHDHEIVKEHFPDTFMIARELIAHGSTGDVLTAENQFKARQMCEACNSIPHTCGKSAA